MTCPHCSQKNPSNVRYCSRCGGSLVGEPKFNRGCFIPMLLILSVLVMSWGMFELVRHADSIIPIHWFASPDAEPTQPTTAPAQP
ncbi:MAG TPA: hypothetical protein VGN72_11760 [Tepidisphaeraceae bacterium]|jgi:predicted nucleic acid-binding Zn ribbon protein|nr:hypothetical protein [Tepidisphaeraceae bacterium]